MEEIINNIQQQIATFEKQMSTIENEHYPHAEFSHLFDLYHAQSKIDKRLDEMDEKFKKMTVQEYNIILNERKNLLTKKKEISESIKKAQEQYFSLKEEADKQIKEKQKVCKDKFTKTLTTILIHVEKKINAVKQHPSNQDQKYLEDLLKIQTLCECKLNELQSEPQPTIINFSDIKVAKEKEQPKKPIHSQPTENPKKHVFVPYHSIYYDYPEGYEKREYYSRRKNTPVNRKETAPSKSLDSVIMDDMNQAKNDDKKIHMHIIDKDFEIPVCLIYEKKKTLYKRMGIHDICKGIFGNGLVRQNKRILPISKS